VSITLNYTAQSQPDDMFFFTSNDTVICKVISLEDELSRLKFQKEM
jgi:hypothetical protein